MDIEKQQEVMDRISQAARETVEGNVASAGARLNESLWKLRASMNYERLRLDKVNSALVVSLADQMIDRTEFLEAIIGNVTLDVTSGVWQRWLDCHMLDSTLAHYCSDMEVLRALSSIYWEAAANYAAGLFIGEEYSEQDFDDFLASNQNNAIVIKRIVLGLQHIQSRSVGKKAIYARYLASVAKTGFGHGTGTQATQR